MTRSRSSYTTSRLFSFLVRFAGHAPQEHGIGARRAEAPTGERLTRGMQHSHFEIALATRTCASSSRPSPSCRAHAPSQPTPHAVRAAGAPIYAWAGGAVPWPALLRYRAPHSRPRRCPCARRVAPARRSAPAPQSERRSRRASAHRPLRLERADWMKFERVQPPAVPLSAASVSTPPCTHGLRARGAW